MLLLPPPYVEKLQPDDPDSSTDARYRNLVMNDNSVQFNSTLVSKQYRGSVTSPSAL